jgi:hypothetical protein
MTSACALIFSHLFCVLTCLRALASARAGALLDFASARTSLRSGVWSQEVLASKLETILKKEPNGGVYGGALGATRRAKRAPLANPREFSAALLLQTELTGHKDNGREGERLWPVFFCAVSVSLPLSSVRSLSVRAVSAAGAAVVGPISVGLWAVASTWVRAPVASRQSASRLSLCTDISVDALFFCAELLSLRSPLPPPRSAGGGFGQRLPFAAASTASLLALRFTLRGWQSERQVVGAVSVAMDPNASADAHSHALDCLLSLFPFPSVQFVCSSPTMTPASKRSRSIQSVVHMSSSGWNWFSLALGR